MPPRFPSALPACWRAVLVCGFVAIALAGCGRKGPLEPPQKAATAAPAPQGKAASGSAQAAQGSDQAASDDGEGEPEAQQSAGNADGSSANVLPSVAPVGSGRKGKPIVAPKKPFILDPIL